MDQFISRGYHKFKGHITFVSRSLSVCFGLRKACRKTREHKKAGYHSLYHHKIVKWSNVFSIIPWCANTLDYFFIFKSRACMGKTRWEWYITKCGLMEHLCHSQLEGTSQLRVPFESSLSSCGKLTHLSAQGNCVKVHTDCSVSRLTMYLTIGRGLVHDLLTVFFCRLPFLGLHKPFVQFNLLDWL